MQDVANLISNIGFPIVITLIMFYFFENITEKYLTSVNDNIAKLDDSIDSLIVIVNRLEERTEKEVNNETNQEASQTLPDNQQGK